MPLFILQKIINFLNTLRPCQRKHGNVVHSLLYFTKCNVARDETEFRCGILSSLFIFISSRFSTQFSPFYSYCSFNKLKKVRMMAQLNFQNYTIWWGKITTQLVTSNFNLCKNIYLMFYCWWFTMSSVHHLDKIPDINICKFSSAIVHSLGQKMAECTLYEHFCNFRLDYQRSCQWWRCNMYLRLRYFVLPHAGLHTNFRVT